MLLTFSNFGKIFLKFFSDSVVIGEAWADFHLHIFIYIYNMFFFIKTEVQAGCKVSEACW